ncbi:MAG: hypothetical protein ACOC3Y_01800, partial [Desulfohalobiaceae bacterium]
EEMVNKYIFNRKTGLPGPAFSKMATALNVSSTQALGFQVPEKQNLSKSKKGPGNREKLPILRMACFE